MRTAILLAFMTFSFSAAAQTIFAPLTIREAKDVAKQEGAFIYAYFFSGRPYMHQRGWLRDSVQALQSKFVNTWIDGRYSKIDTYEYGVKSFPTLIIMDANGNEFFRNEGPIGSFELMDIISMFPEGMQHAYAADSIAQDQPDNFAAQLNRAQAYQEAARNAKRPVAGQLAKISDNALKAATKILVRNREAPAHMKERLKLMKAENLLLRDRAKKAVVTVSVLEKKLHESNQALAYYIKGVAYREIDLPTLAEDYYNKLQLANDNEELLARYQKQR